MKQTYWIWVCNACGEQHQYAGFCDFCRSPSRLVQLRVVPVEVIKGFAWETGNKACEELAASLAQLKASPS